MKRPSRKKRRDPAPFPTISIGGGLTFSRGHAGDRDGDGIPNEKGPRRANPYKKRFAKKRAQRPKRSYKSFLVDNDQGTITET